MILFLPMSCCLCALGRVVLECNFVVPDRGFNDKVFLILIICLE